MADQPDPGSGPDRGELMKHLFSMITLALLPAPLVAQDLRHIEPEQVQPLASPAQAARVATPAPQSISGPILPNLNGLVFFAEPGQLNVALGPGHSGLDASRVAFLDNEAFARHMNTWWSRPLSERSVQSLLAAVSAYYAEHDRPFVSVTAPNQDLSSGVLRVLVVEGQLSEVRVQGNQWFDEDYYRRNLGLTMDRPIQMSQLQAGLDWISKSNPFHSATVLAMPGETFGSTAMELRVSERKPLRLYSGVSNTGTDTTDLERVVFGANWGRAFGTHHQLNAQLSASPDFHKSVGVSGNYRIPLQAWRHVIELSAAWSRINADVPQHFDSRGESWQILAGYELPLSLSDASSQLLRIGIDFKRSDNNLEFGGMPVTDNVTDVVQLALDWRRDGVDAWGQTSLNARLVYSPGDISGRNDDEAFHDSRWGAAADYYYARLDLQRHTPLPARFAWNLSASWQQSSDNLLGSEQLGLSGSGAVRGFRENAFYADEGLLLRNELLLPPLSALQAGWHNGSSEDHLRFHVFYDYGRGNSVERLPGELSHLSIDGVGLGARYYLGRNLSATLEYAWQHRDIPGQSRDQQAHFNLMVSF